MKRCPKCRRDYTDETLNFCLDDGAALLDGPATGEHQTAILPSGGLENEAPTRQLEAFKGKNNSPSSYLPGHRNGRTWLIVALFFGFAFGGYLLYRVTARSSGDRIDSIAVLPFQNDTGDSKLDYISDGMSESLIDKLSHVEGLSVISRTSSFKFRGNGNDLEDIGKRLGVQALVTGKLAKTDDQIVAHVELIEVSGNRQIWGDRFSGKSEDFQTLTANISSSVQSQVRKSKEKTTAAGSPKSAVNGQAYDLFLQAKFLAVNSVSEDDDTKAIALLNQAIAIEPSYAEAMSLLGDIYGAHSQSDPKVYIPLAESTIDRAIRSDPDLADAHGVKGKLLRNQWKWREAESEFKKAIDLNPNLSWVHDSYGLLLAMTRHFDDAVAESHRAAELDPLRSGLTADHAFVLMVAHRFPEAEAEAQRVLRSVPNDRTALFILAFVADATDRVQDAMNIYKGGIERLGTKPENDIQYAYFRARIGDRAGAEQQLKTMLDSKNKPSPFDAAEIYATIGKREEAFEYLELAYKEKYNGLSYLLVDPALESLQPDDRFKDLVKRMNFPEE